MKTLAWIGEAITMKQKRSKIIAIACFVAGILAGSYFATHSPPSFIDTAEAHAGVVKSPQGTAPDRYVYYPGTEALQPEEIRVIACGTGMPSARRSQAATCFLVELGDGQKFLFDIGSGSRPPGYASQILRSRACYPAGRPRLCANARRNKE